MNSDFLNGKRFKTVNWVTTGIVFVLCAIAQIIGYFKIDTFPEFLWDVLDMIPLLMAIVFGFWSGLICLIPTAAGMLVWIIKDQMWNMGFSVLVFLTAVALLSLLRKAILKSNLHPIAKTAVLTAGFEVSLVYSRTLYHGLRTVFSPLIKGKYIQYLRWEKALNLIATWSNLALALILIIVLCIVFLADKKYSDTAE